MLIDLGKDATEVRGLLQTAARKYSERNAHPKAGPHHPAVSAVAVVFEGGIGASVNVSFDCRTDFESDGTWTHRAFAELKRPDWEEAYQELQDEDVKFAFPDGSSEVLTAGSNDEAYIELLGRFLALVLVDAIKKDVFKSLPTQAGCQFLVQDVEGMFDWSAEDELDADE